MIKTLSKGFDMQIFLVLVIVVLCLAVMWYDRWIWEDSKIEYSLLTIALWLVALGPVLVNPILALITIPLTLLQLSHSIQTYRTL